MSAISLSKIDPEHMVKKMSYRLKSLGVFTTTCCLAFAAAGQDFKQALSDMHKTFSEAKRMHIVMDISVFENVNSTTPFYHDKAEVKRDSNNYLYHYSNMDFLMNDQFIVIVDKTEKEIMCSRRDTGSENDFNKQFSFNIDSIFSLFENPKHISREKDIDHYRVFQKNNSITQVDLFINSVSHLIQKTQYLYDNGQFVSIHFDQFDIHPKFKDEEFEEGLYFSKLNGKYQLAEKFKDFKISDGNNQ